MPHDRNGQRLEVGDRVILEAEIVDLTVNEEHTNTWFRLIGPEGEFHPTLMGNSRHAIKPTIVDHGLIRLS